MSLGDIHISHMAKLKYLCIIYFRNPYYQTGRHFTAATNSGVTHLEYLSQDQRGMLYNGRMDAFSTPLAATVTKQVHKIAGGKGADLVGLVDCYRKVCKVRT